ncbi:alpha/beta hydrolase [Hoyosella sp. YIM 151337]|uniref:alpha/beta hydrolase n=1 Tax=Hoyosella sp. YIM 151337 TaxID=2992742 RepID=UPI002235C168|nr:alpha/beta hydrolase [Hoyosella sp. YIM 151337]MCW4355918.1 alpha/beta hydrolase [Hoyosella sp. YIM 151337]
MSFQRQLMKLVIRGIVRPALSPGAPVQRQRRVLELAARVARTPRGVQVRRISLRGCAAEWITTPGADPHSAVLYLHGGGYTVGSPATHRALAAHLSAASGMPVFVAAYRLAPEHPFPAALDDAVTAYEALLERGLAAERITVAGDSAGGGLALSLCLAMRDRGMPAPAGLALLSPWLDLTLTDVYDDDRDLMLRASWLRACAERYCAGDPGAAAAGAAVLAPLSADLTGLPPMLVHAASDEILRPSIERFVARVRSAGGRVRYRKLSGMWHVCHLHAGLLPESGSAVHEVGHFLRETATRLSGDVHHQ